MGHCGCGDGVGQGQNRLEDLFLELFRLHDLDGDGALEESELIHLNEQIAVLHHGPEADLCDVRLKYRELFRTRLDPEGSGIVHYKAFEKYAREVLDRLDPDTEAQEMILEQFVAEARSARHALFEAGHLLPAGSAGPGARPVLGGRASRSFDSRQERADDDATAEDADPWDHTSRHMTAIY